MKNWQAWVAALGGLVSLGELLGGAASTYATVGGLLALVFGVWAAYAK